LAGDTVKLTVDITNHNGTCVEFNNSNIIFECQGHTIDGNTGGGGIDMDGGSNNTVKNCIVNEFYSGIYLYNSDHTTLTDNTVSNNYQGIYLVSSNYNTLVNNTARLSINDGIYLCHSKYNTLTSNNVSLGTLRGIYLSNASNNTLNSNQVCSNTESDFHLVGVSGNSGDENTCDNADGWNDTGTSGCTYSCGNVTTTTTTSSTTTIPSNDTILPVIYASIYPTTGNYSLINITATDNVMVDQILLYTNDEYTGHKDCGSPICNWNETVYRLTPGNYTYKIIANDTSHNSATEYLYASTSGLKGDSDLDGTVDDFEVLDSIDMWAKGIINDFDLLDVIDNWVATG